MNRIVLPLLTLALAFAPVLCWASEPKDDEAKAIAEIEKLGGKVFLDENILSTPVISVDFSNSKVTDNGLASLEGLSQLHAVNLQGTQVTDAGLGHLTGLVRLQWLNLKGTKVTQAGLRQIQASTQLKTLHVAIDEKKTKWVGIAVIDGMDRITAIHLTNLLASKGIECEVYGSVGFGVSVPKQHVDEAIHLIHEDAKKADYFIEFDGKVFQATAKETTKQVRLPIDQVLMQPEFGKDKPLGRFLRSAELTERLHDYPFVESLCIREREFLANKDTTEIGYEVGMDLRPKAGDSSKGYYYRYQVLAQGREVWRQSGREWNR